RNGTGRPVLHRAALLVLPGASIARGRVDAGGPARRRRGTIPARARSRTQQRLVVLWIARTLEGAWRRRGSAKGGSRAGEDLGRRSPAIADIKALTGARGRSRNKSRPPHDCRLPVMDRNRRHLITGM